MDGTMGLSRRKNEVRKTAFLESADQSRVMWADPGVVGSVPIRLGPDPLHDELSSQSVNEDATLFHDVEKTELGTARYKTSR